MKQIPDHLWNRITTAVTTTVAAIAESKIFLILLFLLLLLIRLIYLDADPSFTKRIGDLGDEGIWVHNARTLFLFDNLTPDEATQSLSVSPVNTLLMMASFSLFGVNTGAARLPSALAGWLTLLILYLLIKKAWGKKPALLGLLLLGLNETFLIYNKLALSISVESLFILLSFYLWYQGAESQEDEKKMENPVGKKREKNYFFPLYSPSLFYFLSGISFALALLSKLSAYYFAPIFLVLWILQWYRKEISFSALVWFAAGVVLPLIPYAWYLSSHWDVLATNFLVLKRFYNSEGVVILNLFRSFSNNLFGLPGMFMLWAFTLLYFLSKNRFRQWRSLSTLDLIAGCWLLAGFVILVFWSDLSDRRFYSLLIPMSILSTRLFTEREPLDFNQLVATVHHHLRSLGSWKNAFYALLFSYPFVALVVSSLSLYLCSPIKACAGQEKYMVLAFFSVVYLFLVALTSFRGKARHYFIHFGTLVSLATLFLIPLSTLLRHFSRHYAIITATISRETTYVVGSMAIIVVFIIGFILFSFRFPHWLRLSPRAMTGLFLLSIIVNGTLISLTFIAPSFSFRDSSRALTPMLGTEEATGFLVQILSLEAQYLPILIYKTGSFEEVNADYDLGRIGYVFTREFVDGRAVSEPVNLLAEYETDQEVSRLYLYPYPFTAKYRMIVAVHRVERYKRESGG